MKKTLLYSGIAALGLAVAGSSIVIAHDGDGYSQGDRQSKRVGKIHNRMLERFDQNSDGMLAREEFQAVFNDTFATADADGDNVLNADEMHQQIATMMSKYGGKGKKWRWNKDDGEHRDMDHTNTE